MEMMNISINIIKNMFGVCVQDNSMQYGGRDFFREEPGGYERGDLRGCKQQGK
jgi:hypothetical protein